MLNWRHEINLLLLLLFFTLGNHDPEDIIIIIVIIIRWRNYMLIKQKHAHVHRVVFVGKVSEGDEIEWS